METGPMTITQRGLGHRRLRRWSTLIGVAILAASGLSLMAPAAASGGSLVVKDASAMESAGTVAVKIVLDKRLKRKISVAYKTVAMSAENGADFRAASGRITFPAGTKTRVISVRLLDDDADEATERFQVRIFNAWGASIVDRTGRVSLLDDDDQPRVSIGDAIVLEPDSGSTTMHLPVTLSAPSGRTTEVTWTMTGGNASPESDYTSPLSGSVALLAGESKGYVSVEVLGDTVPEPDETLIVQLSLPRHLVIDDGTATGTIRDHDVPALSVDDVLVGEGAMSAVFTVKLSHPSDRPVTFSYGTIDGSATAGADYVSVSNRTTIAAGETSTKIAVPIKEDQLDEADERFWLTVFDIVNASAKYRDAMALIVDNDPAPALSIADTMTAEGSEATFTVTLSAVSGRQVTVRWTTLDDTALAPGDYTAGSGTLSIPPGEQTVTVTVPTAGDGLLEGDERFAVDLSSPTMAVLADRQGWAFIPANTT